MTGAGRLAENEAIVAAVLEALGARRIWLAKRF